MEFAKENEARRIPGYRGIWFTLGQFFGPGENGAPYSADSTTPLFPYGDKYSGGLGTYTAKHTPLAVYRPEVEKTFFVYGGTTTADQRHLLCMISYYDHRTNTVPQPVVVYDKEGVDDPHDNPSMAIDQAGHIWVFVSGRGQTRPGLIYRSVKPYCIDQFDLMREAEITYPQPHILAEEKQLLLFTKYTGMRELYWTTSRDGKSWASDQKLAAIKTPDDELAGHYQTSAHRGDKTGTFFNRHPNGLVDYRTDLYYLQTKNFGQTWTTVDGQPITPPVTSIEHPCRVIDHASDGLNVYVKDMGFDFEGHPVLLYLTSRGHQPGPPNDPRVYRIVRWDGQAWQRSEVGPADHNYDTGSLYLEGDVWSVIVPGATGPQPYQCGGEIMKYISRDQGATWQLEKQITKHSPRNHNYARRPIDATDPFYTFWADGDSTQQSPSHLYFCDSTGEKVFRLPYEMDAAETEPERV
jgi:hypothetical protein